MIGLTRYSCKISGDIDIYDLKEMIWWLREYTGADITAEITKEEETNETKTN